MSVIPECGGHWDEQAPEGIPGKEGVLRIKRAHYTAWQHHCRGICIEIHIRRLSQPINCIHIRVDISQPLRHIHDRKKQCNYNDIIRYLSTCI